MSEANKIKKTNDEWKKELTPEQYRVLREQGTEPPFTAQRSGFEEDDAGMYVCVACGNELFSADAKFESDSGWPSFTKPVSGGRIELYPDNSMGMERTEVVCGACGGHLGHVFDDGPTESHPKATGKRYCINSIALKSDPNTQMHPNNSNTNNNEE